MIVHRVRHRILRIPLPVPVIVNYQISREPHQPIRKVALFRVVLVERLVDPDENFLCQVLGPVDARGKSVSQIKYSPREKRDNIFPRRAVAAACTSYQFGTIYLGHSL